MQTFLYILLALLVLLVMITVHEFGHYIAGKIFGFKINEFSIGFGPSIYKRTKKDGEVFSIRLLPLGGYCAFEGEDETETKNPEAFNSKPAWKRIIVLLAGVTFNFLFGVLTAAIYLFVAGYANPKITQTISQQGVYTIGLKQGDVIVSVGNKRIEAYRSFSELLKKYEENEEFVVTVERDGELVDVTTKKQSFPAFYFICYDEGIKNNLYIFQDEEYKNLTDAQFEIFKQQISSASTAVEVENTEKASGLAIKSVLSNYYYKLDDEYVVASNDNIIELLIKGDASKEIYSSIAYAGESVGVGIIQLNIFKNYSVFEALGKAWPFCLYLCKTILNALGGLFTGATALKDMGGTVTAVSQIATISQMGINYFLILLPLLAMNLALFNVLPIPSLDGARVIFVLIELIFGKPINRKVEGWIHTIGLFMLLGLVLFFDIYHFAVSARLLL